MTSEAEIGRARLERGLELSGLSYRQLWWRQLTVGGDADEIELEAYILGLLELGPHQHNLIAQALNEHFLERGADHPVPYSPAADSSLPWD